MVAGEIIFPRRRAGITQRLIAGLCVAIIVHSAHGNQAQIERDGVRVRIDLTPSSSGEKNLKEDGFAQVRLAVTSIATGEPVRFQRPGAWLDFAPKSSDEDTNCGQRVGRYLNGSVGTRPLVDLNGYFVLLMNADHTVAVIDPNTRFAGKTNLYSMINLAGKGFDWTKTNDDRRVFVSIPSKGQIGVIDGVEARLLAHIKVARSPGRIALTPNERVLWVGYDGQDRNPSGIQLVDAVRLKPIRFVPLPPGHHEIAFSGDSNRALVTSRDRGIVTLLDGRSGKRLRNLKRLSIPISTGYSDKAKVFFVADAKTGHLHFYERNGKPRGNPVGLEPGIGPMRVTSDGRWILVVNPVTHVIDVVDSTRQRLAHRLRVPSRPFDIQLSQRYAYVRSLDSERISMISLQSLDGAEPSVQQIAVGAKAPSLTPNLPIASGVTAARSEGAMFFVSPSDNAAYFYMEGMNATSSTLQGYGHDIRAVMTVNRGLRENLPGVYTANLRLPASGKLEMAVALDSPRIVHCLAFDAEASASKIAADPLRSIEIEWLAENNPSNSRVVAVKVLDPVRERPFTGLTDVQVSAFAINGTQRIRTLAKESSPGVYQAVLDTVDPGTYYVHLGVPSRGILPGVLPYRSVTIK